MDAICRFRQHLSRLDGLDSPLIWRKVGGFGGKSGVEFAGRMLQPVANMAAT
jgi:hypothetical protein